MIVCSISLPPSLDLFSILAGSNGAVGSCDLGYFCTVTQQVSTPEAKGGRGGGREGGQGERKGRAGRDSL